MISEITIVVDVKVSWWLRYLYIPLMTLFYDFCKQYISADCELNEERVKAIICKGLSAKVVK